MSTSVDAPSLPRLLRADELAETLNYPRARIYELARLGELPHIRFGRAIRFDPQEVRAWLKAGGTRSNGS